MAKDQQMFQEIAKATQNLATVRKPLPTIVDEVAVRRDQKQLRPFFSDRGALSATDQDLEQLLQLTGQAVTMQQVFFNRTLGQITAASLADGILVGFTAAGMAQQTLKQAVTVGYELCIFLLNKGIVTSDSEMPNNFLALIQENRPDLMTAFEMAEGPVADEVQEGSDFFANEPIKLVSDDITSFFAQSDKITTDFNEFIQQMATKNSPAKLQLALTFFNGINPTYVQVFNLKRIYEAYPEQPNVVEEACQQFFLGFNDFIKGLTPQSLINVSKTWHMFLKFCLNYKHLTSGQYQRFLKTGNRMILQMAAISGKNRDDDFEELSQLADTVFTRPNYTIDTAKARVILAKLNMTPVMPKVKNQYAPKLKKKLDAHQLELELKQAKQHLADFKLTVIGDVPEVDYACYEAVLLELHTKMVTDYNRRLSRWTVDSFRACLMQWFKENRQLDQRPAFFRFLQSYLANLEENGIIHNGDILLGGVRAAMETYFITSINALSKA
ncbi:hypothetical protein ACFQ5M_05525 [Agrilactobacillus yilanensis]|uniref:Uncharacterized protein n=1 Tax=Agrilactobacillus yilanensis TaxID=2485997 RepID=A0ABW4J587_9LACO|nr:hypothetical protein [Agrilactobacillus yilanensis]